jgi:hypothetical protein
MSFWNTSENEKITETKEFETGGGDIEVIPAKTEVKAAIDEIKWDEYDGVRFIKARWSVVDGEYKNRKVFQKIRVNESDSKKADKAKRMLAAIATNAGGGLLKLEKEPTDGELQQHLLHKPMVLLLQVWTIPASDTDDGVEKKGNWVSKVAPVSGSVSSSGGSDKPDEEDPFA